MGYRLLGLGLTLRLTLAHRGGVEDRDRGEGTGESAAERQRGLRSVLGLLEILFDLLESHVIQLRLVFLLRR